MLKTTKTKQMDSVDIPDTNPVCLVQCARCGAWMKRISDKRRKALWTCGCYCQISEEKLQKYVPMLLYILTDDHGRISPGVPPKLLKMATMQRTLAEPDKELDCFEFDRVKVKKLLIRNMSNSDDIQDKDMKARARAAEKYSLDADTITQQLSAVFYVAVDKIQVGDDLVRLVLKNGRMIEMPVRSR